MHFWASLELRLKFHSLGLFVLFLAPYDPQLLRVSTKINGAMWIYISSVCWPRILAFSLLYTPVWALVKHHLTSWYWPYVSFLETFANSGDQTSWLQWSRLALKSMILNQLRGRYDQLLMPTKINSLGSVSLKQLPQVSAPQLSGGNVLGTYC